LELILEGSKGGEDKAHTPVETPNNLLSVAYAKVLLAVAEGELAGTPTGRDIFLNGTPLLDSTGAPNFGGVTWEWRPGSVNQSYIQGMPDVSNEVSVGVELKDTTPWVREITKESLSAARVTLNWPALQQQQANGDTVGVTIDYAIDLSTDGGAYQLYQQYQVSGKTNTAYERTHRVNLPPATTGWTMRVRRITPNSTSSLVQDTMNIKSFAEVVDAKQRYPNTALLFVQFDSRLFGGGSIPKISVKTKGRSVRVPANYDPITRVYSGVWDGVFKWAWTDNPVWIFFDIVTQNRFGLGSRVTVNQVDKWELYEVAQYCDVLVDDGTGAGTKEPRHTCNIYIQSQEDAWTVLRDICSIFNGMTYWDGNKFIARADKQEPLDNIPLFGRTNVIGDFDYQTTDERTIFTSALVSYDEPSDHYGTQVEAVWEKSQILRWGGDRQTTMAAVGCTSRGEAQRKGKYTLITNMFNRSVNFKTGLQGLDPKVRPGAIIGVADPLIAGKEFTGRLIAATNRVITLDRVTEAKPGDVMFITRKDGSQEGRTVQAAAGKVITVTTNYSEIALPNSVWYLEADDLKSQLFKITKLKVDGATCMIDAVEYNDSKFAAIDSGARLEPRPISKVPPQAQKAPTPVIISSSSYIEQMQAVTTMTISWPKTENAVLYEGQWRVGQGDWVTLGVTGAQQFNVKGIYTGQYLARVRAINALDVKSAWTLSEATDLNGKAGSPPALSTFTTRKLVFGIGLDWTFPNGAEDTARTEIMYSVTTSFADAIKLGDYAYPQNSHEMHGLAAGVTFFFWARIIDRTGNIGPWTPLSTAHGLMGQSSSDQAEYELYFKQMIGASALYAELNDRIDLIDGNGTGSVNDRINDAVTDLEGQIANITDALVYDPALPYLDGDVVRQGHKLYQAIQDVPVSTPPPNVVYWKDVGTILEEANALASQVAVNTTNIETIDGKVTATASQISGLTAATRDDGGEGALNDALKGWTSTASIVEEKTVRTSENYAMAQTIIKLTADVDTNTATVVEVKQTQATDREANALAVQALNVKADANTAAVQTTSQAVATLDGKVSASWSVKLQVNGQGQYVAAGIGLGIDNGPAGLQSTFLVQADKFAVINNIDSTLSVPFVIQGNQAFIRSAFIQDASITTAKIGGALQSDDWINSTQGWYLPKTGAWQMNGSAGGGKMVINNTFIRFYHPNGNLGIDLSL